MFSFACIIVTYKPNITVLGRLLHALCQPNQSIFLIDNFHPETDYSVLQSLARASQCIFHRLPTNTGIAHAQNVGIRLALEQNPDFLLFFDQDSEPDSTLVENLAKAYLKIQKESPEQKIAALGARFFDPRQKNPPPFIQFKGLKMYRYCCLNDEDIVPVDYLISSGSMVSASALRNIGFMREDLFIDYVDIEWGLRAKYQGYQNFGVCGAKMKHSLGDAPQKFRKKFVPIRSPLRHYYLFRNAILLYKESWIPKNWKLIDGYRLVLKYIYYSIFTNHPWKHCWMMTLGIWHGILGKAGAYPGKGIRD